MHGTRGDVLLLVMMWMMWIGCPVAERVRVIAWDGLLGQCAATECDKMYATQKQSINSQRAGPRTPHVTTVVSVLQGEQHLWMSRIVSSSGRGCAV